MNQGFNRVSCAPCEWNAGAQCRTSPSALPLQRTGLQPIFRKPGVLHLVGPGAFCRELGPPMGVSLLASCDEQGRMVVSLRLRS